MVKKYPGVILVILLVASGVFFGGVTGAHAGMAGEWVETFDDQNFLDRFDAEPGIMGSGSVSATFVDRPGNGKAFQVYNTSPPGQGEVIPFLLGLSSNIGVRWKFDLWIGPRTGTPRHDAADLKFLHYGSDALNHCFKLAGVNPNDVRKTNLVTGDELPSSPTGVPSDNLHLRIIDTNTWNWNINNTDLNTYRNSWITIEIEVVCGNPSTSRIWINDNLDFYRETTGFFTNCWENQIWFANYSDSAGGNAYLRIDNFEKFDTLKEEGSGLPVPGNFRFQ